ncbi:hypothetical protein FOA43_001863 [Brettanomyces nanus]|uniref:Autophagy-related protein 2 n=1 Tax=Eeniella nana TaxID=13502 RepID=A0A875S0V1_EENNA|nr:uncharacterized protein FOA43_001863 [Brettanomyces nanus]QPG74533.1 hypothetical protein FOA43_001863 [Brettanomyces nanus]
MVPQWMPQNIQKRLLKYVLEQLSLFSEIDLPNLDVSIGTNSKITLRSLQLDIDKFNVPGVYIRNGTIDKMDLLLTVSDGVNISCDGIHITMTPSSVNKGGGSDSKIKFSLTKSTVDLAKSATFEDYVDTDLDDDEFMASLEDSIIKSHHHTIQQDDPESYKLNGMMAKAVEYALSKLQVNMHDITITIVCDLTTLEVHIDSSTLTSDGEVKSVRVEGIEVRVVRPGHTGHTETSEDSSPDDEYNDMVMSTSFMAESKNEVRSSLLESVMNTQNSSASVYMSARTEFFDAESQPESHIEYPPAKNVHDKTVIAFIDEVSITFNGLQHLEDIKVKIGKIKVAASPIPDILPSLLTSISQFGKLAMAMQTDPREVKEDNSTDSETPTLLEDMIIEQIEVSLYSELESEGGSRLVINNLKIEQRNTNYCMGSATTVKIVRKGSDSYNIFEFSSQAAKAVATDFEFEIQSLESSQWTIVLPKAGVFNLDKECILWISEYYEKIKPSLDLIASNVEESMFPSTNKKSGFSIKTMDMTFNIKLSEAEILAFKMSPLLYNSLDGVLKVDHVECLLNESRNKLFGIDSIGYKRYSESPKKVRGFDGNNQQECSFKAFGELSVDRIQLKSELKLLRRLYQVYNDWMEEIKQNTIPIVLSKTPKRGKNVHIANSLFLGRTLHIDLNIVVNSIDWTLMNISESFGDITGSIREMGLCKFRNGTFTAFSMGINVYREYKGAVEYLSTVANPEFISKPMVFVKHRDSTTVYLRNMYLSYYGAWLTMFADAGGEAIIEEEATKVLDRGRPRHHSVDIPVIMSDIIIGLAPVHINSRGALVLQKGNMDVVIDESGSVIIQSSFSSISIFLIDDKFNILSDRQSKIYRGRTDVSWTLPAIMKSKGFVNVGFCNTMFLHGTMGSSNSMLSALSEPLSYKEFHPLVDLKLDLDLLKLWLCADSAQCLMQLTKDLKEPVNFTFDERYKTESQEVDTYSGVEDDFFASKQMQADDKEVNEIPSSSLLVSPSSSSFLSLKIVEDFYDGNFDEASEVPSVPQSLSSHVSRSQSRGENLPIDKQHFANTEARNPKVIPLSLSVAVRKGLFYLYDGYDWKETRIQIYDAVRRVQKKGDIKADEVRREQECEQKEKGLNRNSDEDFSADGNEDIVGETLFESIHLGVHAGESLGSVYDQINASIGARDSDTGGTSSAASSESFKLCQSRAELLTSMHAHEGKLRLKRSKNHKVSIEVEDVDITSLLISDEEPHPTEKPAVFENEESAELVGRIGIRVGDVKVVDNLPSSSWKMLLGYMWEAGDREFGSSVLKIGIDNVRPVPQMAATELSLHISILPLRLYVDQDTLDFTTRFLGFRDLRFTVTEMAEDEELFLEKVKVESVKVKLDYKPKKVDYSGIKSGHTTEFMNFFILEGSSMILKGVTLYGVSGFERLHDLLNEIWMSDIKRNQLGGILAGVAPVKSLVKLGSGFKDLVMVPIKEYNKDKRVWRSLEKGASSFGKTTGNEMLRLGVKLAAGTQALLENTEEILGGEGSAGRLSDGGKDNIRRSIAGRSRGSVDSFGEDEDSGRYGKYYYRPAKEPIDEEAIISEDEVEAEALIKAEAEAEAEAKAERHVMSLYSNQPRNLNSGLQTAYESLERNLETAKDALVTAGTRASQSGSAQTAAMEFARATPVMIIRPMIGTTEAISRALLGRLNDVDPEERKRSQDKYKND